MAVVDEEVTYEAVVVDGLVVRNADCWGEMTWGQEWERDQEPSQDLSQDLGLGLDRGWSPS